MKGILCLAALIASTALAAAREYKLYAELLENTPVELSDGAKWMMDKGDVFPVLMYKDAQRRIVLQLGGANFQTDSKIVRILRDNEIPQGLTVYRRNVESYINGKAEKWRSAADPKKAATAAKQ